MHSKIKYDSTILEKTNKNGLIPFIKLKWKQKKWSSINPFCSRTHHSNWKHIIQTSTNFLFERIHNLKHRYSVKALHFSPQNIVLSYDRNMERLMQRCKGCSSSSDTLISLTVSGRPQVGAVVQRLAWAVHQFV